MRADPFTDEELEILRKKSLLGKDVTCLSIVKLYWIVFSKNIFQSFYMICKKE